MGKDVVEAFENAKIALNAPETATVQQEVLELPKGKTFGIFGKERPAKVRAFYEVPDEKPARPAKSERPQRSEKPAPKANKPQKNDKPEKAEKAEKPAAPKPAKSSAKAADFTQTEAYIRAILKGLGITEECSMTFTPEEDDGVSIELDCGENYGVVIGRRGETLDAIQYLVRLFLNKGKDHYKRVSINIGNYREKREQT
ncbi:MAG: KH domain-containing protein, partial [Clostridia bacterium]|nr:KH domain-containing protein [Clostridia bacterium]